MALDSKIKILLFALQLAASFFICVDGCRPRTLALKSAFIKQNSGLTARDNSQHKLPCRNSKSHEPFDGPFHNACNMLSIRGGSYDNYNQDYGYNDEPSKGYSDDYRYNNDYRQETSYEGRNDRYEDDYPPRKGDGYYDDEGRYYEDYDGRGNGRSRRRPSSSSKSALPTVLTSGNRKLGVIFLSSGAAFTALGITLFFNKTLMRLGNLLFVCGIPLMIGPGRTLGYFLQPKKARATGCLVCGIFLVLVGHPVIGILLEIFGLLNLFGNMFPVLMIMAKNLPVVGNLFGGDNGSSSGRRKERRSREDDYYNDGYGGDREYGREQDDWRDKY